MANKARATIDNKTLNAEVSGEYVHVWVSNGPVLGAYRLDRFEHSKLTAKSLAKLFTPSA